MVHASFDDGLTKLTQFLTRYGRYPMSSSADQLERSLAAWISRQRVYYRRHQRAGVREMPTWVKQLEAVPGWGWTIGEQAKKLDNGREPRRSWDEIHDALRQFIDENDRLPSLSEGEGEEQSLRIWATTQAARYHARRLTAARVTLLESLPRWDWDAPEIRRHTDTPDPKTALEAAARVRSLRAPDQVPGPAVIAEPRMSPEAWLERADQVRAHALATGILPGRGGGIAEAQLAAWIRLQRIRYRGTVPNALTGAEICTLEAIPGWRWNPRGGVTADWHTWSAETLAFVDEHGRLPTRTSWHPRERQLGYWLQRQTPAEGALATSLEVGDGVSDAEAEALSDADPDVVDGMKHLVDLRRQEESVIEGPFGRRLLGADLS